MTFVAAAQASGRCDVRADSAVVRIEAGEDDRIAAVLVGGPEGRLERIATPILVLAAGAVETPRLLLASDNLGNESGQVGRNFMETLFAGVGALHPEPQHGRRGLPSDAISWDFNAPDAIPGVIGHCGSITPPGTSGLPGFRPMRCARCPDGDTGTGKRSASPSATRCSPPRSAKAFPTHAAWCRWIPISATATAFRSPGYPPTWRSPTPGGGEFMARMVLDITLASGAEDIFESYTTWDRFLSTHVFGTCRMGDNSATLGGGRAMPQPSLAEFVSSPTPAFSRHPVAARRLR